MIDSKYNVTLSNGKVLEVNGSDLWKVQFTQDIAKQRFREFTTEQLTEVSLYQQTVDFKNWSVWLPLKEADNFPEQPVPIPPYILGVLLGDGCFTKKSNLSFSNTEADIIEKVHSYLLSVGDNYRVVGIDTSFTGSNLRNILKDIGLNGCLSDTKFIPECYKNNSHEVRLELLKGLMDTDGNVTNSSYEYSTASAQLSEDIKWLVESLGGYVNTVKRPTHYTKGGIRFDCMDSYRMYIKAPIGVKFHASIKHETRYKTPKTNPRLSIRSVELA